MKKREKRSNKPILINLIKIFTAATLFTPLVVADSILHPFIFGKMIFFYLVASILFFLYLCLILNNKEYLPSIFLNSENKPKNINWFLAAIFSYVSLVAISTFFSVNPKISFFGTPEWSNGLLVILFGFGLFIVAISVFREKKDWLDLLRINTLIGVIVAIFAFFQGIQSDSGRVYATFGNAIYMANYLIYPLFSGLLVYFLAERRDKTRILYLIGSILILFITIFRGDTRGTNLGILGGTLIAASVLCFNLKNIILKRVSLIGFATVLIISICLIIYGISSGYLIDPDRFPSFFTRFVAWKMTLEGIIARPLFGWGLESFYIPFEKFFDPAYYDQHGGAMTTEFSIDLPHNKVLDVAIANGIPALLSYLSIFVSIYYFAVKSLHRLPKAAPLVVGLFATAFIQNLSSFDLISTYIMFFFFLGLAYFLFFEPRELPLQKNPCPRLLSYIFIPIAITAIGFIMIFLIFKPYQAARFALLARADLQKGNYLQSIDNLKKMKKFNVVLVNETAIIQQMRSTLSIRSKIYTDDQKAYLIGLAEMAEVETNLNPGHFYTKMILAKLYNINASFDQSYNEKLTNMLTPHVEQGSKRIEVYEALILNDLNQKDYDGAQSYFQKMIDCNPNYGPTYFLIATVYDGMGEKEKTLEYIEKAIDRHHENKDVLQAFLNLSANLKKSDKVIKAYIKFIELEGDNPQYYASLAAAYRDNGEYDKARQTTDKIIELYPSQKPSVEKFLQTFPAN